MTVARVQPAGGGRDLRRGAERRGSGAADPGEVRASFLDLAQQLGALHFALGTELIQDGAAPAIERGELFAAREHRLADDAERAFKRCFRVLFGKTSIEM